MLELLKNKIKQKTLSFKENKEHYKETFFSRPEHQWIKENRNVERAFAILIDSFTPNVLKFINESKPIIFAQSNGRLSCALSASQKANTVILFPDLIKILKSVNSLHGVAVLAHEIGHLYFKHTERDIPVLEAQIEADFFAYKLGFGHEIQDVIMDHDASIDGKVRVAKLTALLIQDQKEV